MDLNELNLGECADKGALLTLVHPVTGKPLEHKGKPMTITVAGIDSVAFRRKQRELNANRVQAMAAGNGFDFDSTDNDDCEILAAITIGWSGIFAGGKELKFSFNEAVNLYKKFVWIREQVDIFAGDRNNFFTVK